MILGEDNQQTFIHSHGNYKLKLLTISITSLDGPILLGGQKGDDLSIPQTNKFNTDED